MGKTREIKKRIKAVGNIKRITRTMQMIATSKFARAQQRATATKPYTEGVFNLVSELAETAGNLDHPLINGPDSGFKSDAKELTLLITSDRGLCGPYNGNILRTATNLFKKNPATREGDIELVGKKGEAFLKFNGIPVSQTHSLGDSPTFAQIEELAESYMDRFIAGEITAVRVIYMRFISAGKQTPEVLNLLPLKPPSAGGDESKSTGTTLQYEFSPNATELLAELLPSTVKASLFQAFNDAIVSEHVARMVAMKAATDNAGSMGKGLTRVYNRARQAQITTELTEIISGAAALD
ncbi:MAG: ATP synthase F1 subunit gamma [Phycisphaera sp.]|nr:MAG: ATP synthase F1 subunit gamma [Phycisphaera sp.]